jgi:hypothetical protein
MPGRPCPLFDSVDSDVSSEKDRLMLIGLILTALVVASPAIALFLRFKNNDEPVPGGSFGSQLPRRKKNDMSRR